MRAKLRGIAVAGTKCYSVQVYDEQYSQVLNSTMAAAELQKFEVSLLTPATSMLLEYAVVQNC